MTYLRGKSILVTGGTGSFGKAFITRVLADLEPRRVAILSRDELKQYEFRNQLGDDDRLRWFIGDVRDLSRLQRAFHGVDVVVHAAALKQVDTAEYNPFECIATNVLGAENVINAAIDAVALTSAPSVYIEIAAIAAKHVRYPAAADATQAAPLATGLDGSATHSLQDPA